MHIAKLNFPLLIARYISWEENSINGIEQRELLRRYINFVY